jgi:hypothetical protein
LTTKALKKLPRTDAAWEVGMIHTRFEQGGATAIGLLVVVERGSGTIRSASAVLEGESPAVVFREALVAPAPPAKPSRPKHVVLDDPWLRDALSTLLEEAGVLSVATEATPALDDAIARLLRQGGAPAGPGIDHDLPGWRAALQDLIRLAPWSALDDRVEFTFVGGGLDGSVATLMGHRGELFGVVLHATRADLDAVRAARAAGDGRARTYASVHLMLEPRKGLSADEVERCLRVGLQFPPGLYPRVYVTSTSGFAEASADAQRRLLTAVRAVTALCRRDLSALGTGARRTVEVEGVRVTAGR